MKAELIICVLEDVENELTLNDLANLTKRAEIDYVEENAEFVIRMASSSEDLIRVVKSRLGDARGSSCVVISDQLITFDAENHNPKPSSTAEAIFEQVRHSTSVCGLIALTRTTTPHVQGIDANVVSGRKWRDELRRELEKITARLWYKKPSNIYHIGGHLFSVEITPVSDQKALLQSLKLRGRVYSALGYIEQSSEKSTIEIDAYDLTAVHFLALDRANRDRLAGTMRLIIPGSSPISMVTHRYNPSNYENWCRNIANTCVDRQWWRTIERGSPTALPVLGAFTYFEVPDQTLEIDESIMPRNICELSRVIVAPEYRGMGISSLLVNHAISVAKELHRQYLWIECAPHHIKMYQKYGFVVKDHQGRIFYERAQRLDTWAVAMFLDLASSQHQIPSANAVCYRLQIAEGRAENGSLLFQFAQQIAADIEQIFDSPLKDDQAPEPVGVRGTSTPLKKLISSTLICRDIDNFINCLEQLVNRVKVERLSLQHGSGRTFSFNPHDINSSKRKTIESGLLQWFR